MEPDPAQQLEVEIAILRRVAQGDRRAFEELYDRFSGVLFSTAYRVLNNQEAAEDVLQDVFIQIWEKAPLYDPSRDKPMTWAVTLTRHKAIDRLRSTQRRSRLQDDVFGQRWMLPTMLCNSHVGSCGAGAESQVLGSKRQPFTVFEPGLEFQQAVADLNDSFARLLREVVKFCVKSIDHRDGILRALFMEGGRGVWGLS